MNPRQFLNQIKEEDVTPSESQPAFSLQASQRGREKAHRVKTRPDRGKSKTVLGEVDPAKMSKEERDKRKRAKKAQRDQDIQKLMQLQVQQARMLMDLIRQKTSQEDEMEEQLKSSVASAAANTVVVRSRAAANQSMLSRSSVSSHYSMVQHKSTVELIQAIYKQMDKINAELHQKHPLKDSNMFCDLEKKMHKLTKKYQQLARQNQLSEQRARQHKAQDMVSFDDGFASRARGSMQGNHLSRREATKQASQTFQSISSGAERQLADSHEYTEYTVRTEEQCLGGAQAPLAVGQSTSGQQRSRLLNIEDHSVMNTQQNTQQSVGLQAGYSPPVMGLNESSEFPPSAARDHLLSTKRKTRLEVLDQEGSQARESTIDRLQDFNQQFPSVRPGSVRSPKE